MDFIQKELPSKYEEIKKNQLPAENKDDIPTGKKKSILDRIKPRNKKNAKVLQEIADEK